MLHNSSLRQFIQSDRDRVNAPFIDKKRSEGVYFANENRNPGGPIE